MRAIKFRAWQKYHKKMVEVTSISFDNTGEINGVTTFVENQAPQRINYRDGLLGGFFLKDDRGMVLELMQFTGLKDINGGEIFEGDIVKIDDYFNGKMKAKVIFEKGSFGFVGIDRRIIDLVRDNWNDDFLSTSYLSWAYDHPDNDLSNVIIIGNIYENPELLEVAK